MIRCSRFVLLVAATVGLQTATGQALFPEAFGLTANPRPKREFRGAWIATVANIDWPSSYDLSTDLQKNELVSLFDKLKAAGINAVIFQVRTECDAFYQSSIEPWSYWLTGQQGKAPNPFYDPLQFAIAEAHKRGMELHAWFNPYRAVRPSTYTRDTTHVSVRHKDWLLTFSAVSIQILDPGLPQVRDYVTSVIMDIVRRYDVDGIHADDYFYPYPDVSFNGIVHEDDSTYLRFNPDSLDRATWRRKNVNLLIKEIGDSIKAVKPSVKFGISPFGIWKNQVPAGIVGLDAYSTIYCDAISWLKNQYVDYLAPQLYWSFNGGQDYGKLQPWWADSVSAYGRHLYTGNATYRIGSFGPAGEIANQINFNRSNPKVQGSIQFSASSIRDNVGGWTDMMKSDVFLYPSAIPVMPWKETTPPYAPTGLAVESVPGSNLNALRWNPPTTASDGDTAMRYLVYRFNGSQPSDLENSKNIIAMEGSAYTIPSARVDSVGVPQYYFAVSSLDRNNNESPLSTPFVQISSSISAPTLAFPSNGSPFPRYGSLKWTRPGSALSFRFLLASDSAFASLLSGVWTSDTVFTPSGLQAQQTYYWRVVAGGQGGTSQYANTASFKAGWLFPPALLLPPIAQNISRTPTFAWSKIASATSYEAKVTDVIAHIVVIDTTVMDTTFMSSKILDGSKLYGWVVAANNLYGPSDWSVESRFRTEIGTFVERENAFPTTYELSQNYPNPFNPTTRIQFKIPKIAHASLKIYDILGREVATLADETLMPGLYTAQFDANRMPSGTYIFVLTSGGNRFARKMMVIR